MPKAFDSEHFLATIRGRQGSLISECPRTATGPARVRCSQGHVWTTQPYRVKRGAWCPYCAGRCYEADLERRVKKCSCCDEWKPFEKFVSDPRKKLGITSDCKACRNRRSRIWAANNPAVIKKHRKTPEEMRIWRQQNPGKNAEYGKRWRSQNRTAIAKSARLRRQSSVHVRMLSNLRGRLNDALKRHSATKARPVATLIGCTIEELRQHLMDQFLPGMSWDTYGKGEGRWHIDHILPCNLFDLSSEEQQRACFHYSNLQPLWERENLVKGKGVYRKKGRSEGKAG